MRLSPLTVLLAAAAPSLAQAADKPETIVVETDLLKDAPSTPKDRPEKPEFALKLPSYSLDTLDLNFPSGLRILFQADHSQPVVSITTVYDRGSTSDPLTKEGIAHFVEHLWFRSEHVNTQTGERLPKVWDILSELGCSLNASTADDWTNYMSVCPSSSLPSLLRLESLRMTETVEGVKSEVVDTEREVIRNELRMRYENTWMSAMPYLFEHLYPAGHPYARLGIGSHESLSNIKLEDIQEFTRVNYRPENTTIVVVGDFKLEDVQDLVFENFAPQVLHPKATEANLVKVPRVTNPDKNKPGDWTEALLDPEHPDKFVSAKGTPPKRVSGPATEPPMPHDQILSRHTAPIEDPMVVVAWTVPGGYRDNTTKMSIMANIAGGYMSDYFRNNDSRVRADSSGCFLWDSKVDSKVICAIELKTADVDPDAIAEKAVDQVAFMWDQDYNYDAALNVKWIDTMLSRFKMQSLASILQSLDLFATVGGGRATDIAHHAHFTGSAQYHSDAMREAMAIKGDEIAKLAETYLRRDRYVKVFLEPLPKDDVLASAAQSTEYRGASGGDDVIRSSVPPEKITAQVIKDFTIVPDASKIVEKTLPNGLRVIVMKHGETPVAEASLILSTGWASDDRRSDTFAEDFSLSVWNDFARRSDPLRIAGEWDHEYAAGNTRHTVSAASGNLDGVLWLLREGVEEFRPNFASKVQYFKDAKSHIKRDWKERDGYYNPGFMTEHRNAVLMPSHPMGHIQTWEDIEAMASRPSSDVMSWIHQKYQPANATLLIVGNIDANKAARLAEYYFQGWKPANGVTPGKAPALPNVPATTEKPRVVVYDKPKNTQTNVTFACQAAAATPRDDAALDILTDYLDERAWIILRERGGVTYGAGAAAYQSVGRGAVQMFSLVQNNGTVLAVQTFEQLAKDATEGKFDFGRVQVNKLNRAKRYVLNQQSIPQMRSRLLRPVQLREDWTLLSGYADRLAAVDGKAMQARMGDCVNNYLIQVEGPKDEIVPMLEAAKIQHEVFDWKQAGRDRLAKYDPKAYAKLLKAEAKDKAKKEKEDAKKAAEGGTPPATP